MPAQFTLHVTFVGWSFAAAFFLLFFVILPSIRVIGPTEVGLVMKRFSWSKLTGDCPIG